MKSNRLSFFQIIKTPYHKRILELLSVEDYIPIRSYVSYWNTSAERNNALVALCREYFHFQIQI